MKITLANYVEDDFWFNALDVEFNISENEAVMIHLKKLYMESELKMIFGIQYDPVLSEILKVNVFYMSKGKKKAFIRFMNKQCNLDIDLNIRTIKLLFNNEAFLIAQSDAGWYKYDVTPDVHCVVAQNHFNRKNPHDIIFYRMLLRKIYGHYYKEHNISQFGNYIH